MDLKLPYKIRRVVPTWSKLSLLYRLKIVKSTYIWLLIVPLAAHVFNGVEGLNQLTIFGNRFDLHLSLPFSWKAFYFCALSLTLGNLLMFLRCFKVVSENASFQDFTLARKNETHLYDYASEISESLFHGLRDSIGRTWEEQDEKMLRDHFWDIYRDANCRRTFSRACCAALYSLGLLLITIVFTQNLLAVLRIML